MIREFLAGLPAWSAYLLVAAMVTAETGFLAGLVLPAATALIAMGLLANAGFLDIGTAWLVACGAAIAGGSLAFWIGRWVGPTLRSSRLGRRIGDARWDRAASLFEGFGGRAVFVGQWVVVARTLVPRLAAMNGVRYRRFVAWHVPAAAAWASSMVGASYLAGASYQVVSARAGGLVSAVALLAVLGAALLLAGRRFGIHPSRLGRRRSGGPPGR